MEVISINSSQSRSKLEANLKQTQEILKIPKRARARSARGSSGFLGFRRRSARKVKQLIYMFSIVGLPGVGKSTLIDLLKQDIRFKDYTFVNEPVDDWIKSGLLDRYYENPSKYAFEFQTTVLNAYFDTLPSGKYITERNADTNRIFAKLQHDEGYINDKDWEEYEKLFNLRKSEYSKKETVIYIQLPLQEILSRIKKRGRTAEMNITIDYLRKLEQYHDDYILYANYIVIGAEEMNPDSIYEIISKVGENKEDNQSQNQSQNQTQSQSQTQIID